jgi:signal transduction histidine kinase
MIPSVQRDFSNHILRLKTILGNLVELVENWVLALGKEDERKHRLQDLEKLLLAPDSGLSAEIRQRCGEHLTFLLGNDATASLASVSFRQKLQNMFRDQLERFNAELDEFLKSVHKLMEALDTPGGPAGNLILAQENERKRISREIHDGPAQTLASLTMRVDFCLERLNQPDVIKAELVELKDSIVRNLKDIRRFIFDLRPMALDDLGLIPTLDQFIAGFKARSGIAVSFSVDGTRVPMEPEKELAVFRVVQESINNAGRHAQARSIMIFLNFDADKHELSGVIKDDGAGFDVEKIRKNYGSLKKLGLLSMEERIKIVGGKFSLVSRFGEGTIVSFALPVT